MVWGDHDNRFKELNSQLLKECNQLDWTGHAGHAVSGTSNPAFENPEEAMWVDEDDVMAVTAQSSGQTLKQLAGLHGQHGIARVPSDPRRAAAMAASARLASAANSPTSSRSVSPEASRAGGDESPQEADSALLCSRSAVVAAGAEIAINPDADIASMGHRDPSTEQAEDAMRALGSMEFAGQAAELQLHNPAANKPMSELGPGQQPAVMPSQLPHQQIGNKTTTLASSSQPMDNAPSGVMHTQSDSGKVPESQHQAALLHTQHAQHGQRGDDQLQAAAEDHHTSQADLPPSQQQGDSPQQYTAVHQEAAALDDHMSQADLPASQQPQPQGPVHHRGDSSQLQTAADQEAVGQQDDSSQVQTAADQEAGGQQDDYTMDADPDDPAVQRYRQAEAAIAQLKFEAGASGQQSALQTLSKILQVWV